MRIISQWTHRLGFLVPSVNAVLERDAVLSLPPAVSAHFARMPITRDEPEQLDALADAAPPAAELLAHPGCAALVFACTTGSLYRGLGFDDEITRRITAATGIPASTTSTAVVRALRSLDVTRVLLVSPYEPWLDALVEKFLAAHGITVTAARGPALPDPRDCDAVPPAEIAAATGDPGDAEAVLVSCTAFRGLEAAGLLRDRLDVPVVSSNEATFWAALRLAGRGPGVFPPGGYLDLRR
ncbi:maleate cis-trans isomerase [Actinomycetes bacterium KLBMP 9797]